MTVGELDVELLAYRPERQVVVIVEKNDEVRSYEIRSVDEATDEATGKSYVFLACGGSNEDA